MMRRRKRALSVVVGMAAMLVAACGGGDSGGDGGGDQGPGDQVQSGGEPVEGGTLVIAADADPIGLDPGATSAFSSWDFTALIYTGLLRWNSDMEIEPDLATSYDNPDPTTYVFHLREGVTFHNGQGLTADDVKHTFDRIMDPDFGSPRINDFQTIDEVVVDDPLTVTFNLTSPDAAFLSYLATNPAGAIVPAGVDDLDTDPIGTGPFKFDSYVPNQQLELVANEDYYEDGLPYLDGVTFRFFGDQSSIISALRSQQVDMTWLKDPKVAENTANSNDGLVSAPGQTSRTFPVWMNSGEPPLDDPQVRQALSVATDRDAALQTVLGGSGEIATLVPSSQIGGYTGDGSDFVNYQYEVETARALLSDAGYPDGIDLGIYKIVAANDLDVQAAQILQQQWAEAGIAVELDPMETAPLLEDWNDGNFTLLSVAQAWTPDPDAIVGRFSSANARGAAMGMADSELDTLLEQARTELDPETRADVYQQVQELIVDEAYVLNIYGYPLRWEMWWDYVHGYEVMASNIRLYVRTTWLDK